MYTLYVYDTLILGILFVLSRFSLALINRMDRMERMCWLTWIFRQA